MPLPVVLDRELVAASVAPWNSTRIAAGLGLAERLRARAPPRCRAPSALRTACTAMSLTMPPVVLRDGVEARALHRRRPCRSRPRRARRAAAGADPASPLGGRASVAVAAPSDSGACASVRCRRRRHARPPPLGSRGIDAPILLLCAAAARGVDTRSLIDCRCVSRSSSLMHQRQEIVARQLGLVAQHLEIVLEGVRAALDRRQSERGRLALDRMRLPEQAVELLAERRLLARRLAQHGVDHLHRRRRSR